MLLLFRVFLTLFLGVDTVQADRLTDLRAWRNPIAQVRLLTAADQAEASAAQGPDLHRGRTGPTWKQEDSDGGQRVAGGGAHVPRAHRDSRPGAR